jgi:uncharacterized lipoprotein YddW (UPF0748 family)
MPSPIQRHNTALATLSLLLLPLSGFSQPQYRGFYVTAFSSGAKTRAQIDRLVADVIAAHGNLLIVQVGRRGDAYYNKSFQPRTEDPDLPVGFDALQYLIEKAHSVSPRIEVHAWLSTCAMWTRRAAPINPEHVFNRHGPGKKGRENWFTRRVDGTYLAGSNYWLDPGHPDAVDYVVQMYAFLVANYAVDGIHLDRVRYPELAFKNSRIPEWGYNETAVARFNQAFGRTGKPAAGNADWIDWRREALAGLVRKIYLVCTAINPRVKISASTIAFGAGPTTDSEYRQSHTYRQVLQDPVGWLQEGIIDLSMPLNYDRESDSRQRTWFEDWIRFEKERTASRHVVPVTAPYLNTLSNSMRQYRKVLASAPPGERIVDGVAGFSYQSFSSRRVSFSHVIQALTQLSSFDPRGPLFATPVATPETPWKSNPTTGYLMGWLTAANGSAIDGARILIQGAESRWVKTDGSGWFGSVDLIPGEYTVASVLSGARDRVVIAPGKVAVLRLRESQRILLSAIPSATEIMTNEK